MSNAQHFYIFTMCQNLRERCQILIPCSQSSQIYHNAINWKGNLKKHVEAPNKVKDSKGAH